MFRQVFVFLVLIFSIFSLNAAQVFVDVDIYSDYSLFNYEFKFDGTESYRSFSFEKPKDSVIDFIKSGKGNVVKYSVAGDYLIINPKSVKNDSFIVRFTSKSVSEEIFEKNSFTIYSNFNFLVDELVFNVELKDDIGDISSFYPRQYRVLEDDSFEWNLKDLGKEELFRLEFSDVKSKEEILKGENSYNKLIVILGSILVIVFIFVVFIFIFSNWFETFKLNFLKFDKKKNKKDVEVKKIKKSKDLENEKSEDKILDNSDNKENEVENSGDKIIVLKKEKNIKNLESDINEEEFREVLAKFLTDNEKLVVGCVKENYGISQYDILNFIPSLTKSNLSKIISKLDNKYILKRIRVGKVNKIYLGSRFDLPKVNENSK